LPDGESQLDYSEFKLLVREAGEKRAAQGGLVPIPELRRLAPVERREFDAFILAMHREGVVHLLSHVEPDKLSENVREACVAHPSGALLYWLRWL
jgi:hypothetical protein